MEKPSAILNNSLPIYIPSVSLNMIFFPCSVADAISGAAKLSAVKPEDYPVLMQEAQVL